MQGHHVFAASVKSFLTSLEGRIREISQKRDWLEKLNLRRLAAGSAR